MSVVIATLGGDSLKDTIDALNGGTVRPAEILICIPQQEAHRVSSLASGNVKIVVTEVRGQVPQRAIGFQSASQDVVMQIDDDMLVEERCIEQLLDTLQSKTSPVAVAPALFSVSSGDSVYRRADRNRWVEAIYQWAVNGGDRYRPGSVDRAGSGIGIDPAPGESRQFEAEWLPGGCVLHRRQNLIMENFYPFPGKAYYEDLIHSYHLRRKGCTLILDSAARCWMAPIPVTNFTFREFIKHLVSDHRARRYYVRLASRSLFRAHAFYVMYVLNYLRKRLRGRPAGS